LLNPNYELGEFIETLTNASMRVNPDLEIVQKGRFERSLFVSYFLIDDAIHIMYYIIWIKPELCNGRV
jgi:hypothetical protein